MYHIFVLVMSECLFFEELRSVFFLLFFWFLVDCVIRIKKCNLSILRFGFLFLFWVKFCHLASFFNRSFQVYQEPVTLSGVRKWVACPFVFASLANAFILHCFKFQIWFFQWLNFVTCLNKSTSKISFLLLLYISLKRTG